MRTALKRSGETDDHDRHQPESTLCNVAILCPGSTEFAGGVGQCVSNLMTAMPHADAGVIYNFIDTRGSNHIVFSPLYFAGALVKLVRLCVRGRVDVIHANLSARGSTLRKLHVSLLAWVMRVPLVLHLHDGRFDRFYNDLPTFARWMVCWMFRRADRVLVLSAYWSRFTVDKLGVTQKDVDVVCNAVPQPNELGPGETQEIGLPHIVFLGRLWEPKGVMDLIEALGSFRLRGLDWRATLAGDGCPSHCQEKVREMGISERFNFPGWQNRAGVDRLLSGATVLVLPSHVEGLPMVVLEALARRVPVVATSVGAIPEYLTNDVSALLVAPRDVDGLSRALAAIITSAELRSRLAVNGEQLFHRHFDVAVTAKKIASIYRTVVSAHP